MVELFNLQRYLDPEGLRSRGLEHFDGWAANFGEIIESMEISPDGQSLKARSRFAKFVNLPELQQMFRSFADVQTADMLDLPRPSLEGGKATVIACPMSEEQHELQQELVARYERLRSQKVDPREDNALAITTDGRKLALDARMLSATAPDFPGSKVNALVDNVAAIWRRTEATRRAQMIFCDMGVHPTAWGYSAYDDVIGKLVARGIPRRRSPPWATPTPMPASRRCSRKCGKDRCVSSWAAPRKWAPAPTSRNGWSRCIISMRLEAGRGRAARGTHPAPGQ